MLWQGTRKLRHWELDRGYTKLASRMKFLKIRNLVPGRSLDVASGRIECVRNRIAVGIWIERTLHYVLTRANSVNWNTNEI
jgi:hypothetical protein